MGGTTGPRGAAPVEGAAEAHWRGRVPQHAFQLHHGRGRCRKVCEHARTSSQGGIGDEPLECGQIWTLSPGGQDEHPGLFRLEVTEGPGSGVRVLNNPGPAAFKESIRCAEQNLYARAQQLVGDRDPRSHEFSVQFRGFDAAKSAAKTSVAALIALASALLKKSVRGGLVVVGEVTLGGTIELIHNAITLAEIAVEKGAKSLLLPVSCRRQLFDLSDEMATKLDVEFYQDGRDALLKALAE